ncbi:putative pentatricopeptide repeat-containing protein [Trifolium repens]|nr:putative pentatricopeptide repeat-containing protein [Trifolium repens]
MGYKETKGKAKNEFILCSSSPFLNSKSPFTNLEGLHASVSFSIHLNSYGKCGCLKDSEKVFKTVSCVNLVTWTTMISCYGMHGKGEGSVFLFEKMMNEGFRPNAVTLTSILASCSHSGLMDQGKKIFSSMISDYGFEPTAEHYASMGYLEEPLRLLERMKLSSVTGSMWGALLAGCVMHKNAKIGESCSTSSFSIRAQQY